MEEEIELHILVASQSQNIAEFLTTQKFSGTSSVLSWDHPQIMAILEILHHPDPRLRKKAAPVNAFDDNLAELVADMFETMYAAPGIGLAATQVDVHKRVIVIDVSRDKSAPSAFVNPVIVATSGDEEMEEGCLSVPDVYETVRRAESIRVEAQNVGGESFSLAATGILAICIQHEIDHLEGKLFVDYLSQMKQTRIRRKLTKKHRLAR